MRDESGTESRRKGRSYLETQTREGRGCRHAKRRCDRGKGGAVEPSRAVGVDILLLMLLPAVVAVAVVVLVLGLVFVPGEKLAAMPVVFEWRPFECNGLGGEVKCREGTKCNDALTPNTEHRTRGENFELHEEAFLYREALSIISITRLRLRTASKH